MVSVEYDLRFLQAGVEVLQNYLLSDVLYWPAGISAPPGEPEYPPLTLGNLLFARQRLLRPAIDPPDSANNPLSPAIHRRDRRELFAQMDACRQRWRQAWGRKAEREFRARLTQWQAFLSDYRSHGADAAGSYTSQVRTRALLALLQPELVQPDEAGLAMLAAQDKTLRAVFLPGAFVWEAGLADAFPSNTYWFLYGELRK